MIESHCPGAARAVLAAGLAALLGCAPAAEKQALARTVEFRAQVERLIEPAKGRVGVAVCLLETGETVSVAGEERFPMQSVYKLPIAMAVLHDVDRGTLALDRLVRIETGEMLAAGQHSPIRDAHPQGAEWTVRELLSLAVSQSDGTASDALLRLVGGPGQVTEYLWDIGVREVAVATTEKEIGRDDAAQHRNWATPHGALELLRVVHQGRAWSKESHALLVQLLTETSTGPRRIRGHLPPGTVVAHKTGSSGTVDGRTAATNDIGIVVLPDGRHLAVAVLVADSPADEATREGVIADVARAALEWAQT